MASQRTTKAPLDIKIVGAGMSGLSVAISCVLAGHNVVVLEGAKELAEVSCLLHYSMLSWDLMRRSDRRRLPDHTERQQGTATV